MEDVPKSFQWVEARARWSVREAFQVVCRVAADDTAAAQALGQRATAYRFEQQSAVRAAVIRRDKSALASETAIVFSLFGGEIVISRLSGSDTTELFRCRPIIHRNGEPMLTIRSDAMYPWEISRRALEPLIFAHDA